MDPSQILNQILSAAGISAGVLPETMNLTPWAILRAVLILVVVYLLARLVRSFLARTLGRLNLEPRVGTLIGQISFYGIISLGVIWVLGGFGLSVIVLGIVGGLTLKDLIQNFAAGMLILGTRPFHPGDWIVVSGNEGIVAEIGWRGTMLDTFDGRRVIVPNSSVVNSIITNNSLQPQLRSTLRFSVNMNLDFASVESLILDALRGVEGIAMRPAPRVLLDTLSGDAMNLIVWIWILDPVNQQRDVVSNAQRAVKEHLQAHNISLNPAVIAPPPNAAAATAKA
jgi:small conductance mechanosensitive channel